MIVWIQNIIAKNILDGVLLRTGISFLFFCFMFSAALLNIVSGTIVIDNPPKVNIIDSLGWKVLVSSGVNLSQSAYSNWIKGGESALAWMLSTNSHFIYNSQKYIITTEGKFLYGKTKIGGSAARKSEDRINIETMLQNKKPIISLFASLRAETQFDLGKKFIGDKSISVSKFADPLYLYQSGGVVYNYRQNFQTRLGISFKETRTQRFPLYSDKTNTAKIEKIRFERGLESQIKGKIMVMKNLTLSSEAKLFSTLVSLISTDIEFENILTAVVNKYVVVNFNYYLIYDRSISLRAQIFEGLSLGLRFNMW